MALPLPARRPTLAIVLAALALACSPGGDGGNHQVPVRVETVVLDGDSKSPIVVLAESEGDRRLPIWIGFAEAQSIAARLHEVESIRPNTHDLAKRLIDGLEGSIERVVVSDLDDGIYYARIVLRGEHGAVEVDARPSDAIAIALRVDAPVFVSEPLFERSKERENREANEHRI